MYLGRLVHLLKFRGGDVSVVDKRGFNVLHHASTSGNVPLLKMLLDKEFNIAQKTNEGFTLLLIAARIGRVDALEFLISKGENLL